MSKTWETLFNLTSFMKYLLAEVLPDEKVDSPLYVLASLQELLTVTAACIEKVRSASLSESEPASDSSLQALRPARKKEKLERYVKNLNNNDVGSEGNSSEKPVVNSEENPKLLPANFITLNKEMHNGRPSGYYCRPCDEVLYTEKLWAQHCSGRLHDYLNGNYCIKQACDWCNLTIFSTHADAEKMFTFHQKDHYDLPNIPFSERNKISECRSSVIRTKSNSDQIVSVSPVFIELDKLMHSGTRRGFYCQPCDKSFNTFTKWNKHFGDKDDHNNATLTIQTPDSFQNCDRCKLVIFAEPSVLTVYKAFHDCGHSDNDKNVKSNRFSRTSSTESINIASPEPKQESCEFKKRWRNEGSSNKYVICDQFKVFNAKLHSFELQGWYYCRPCNAALSPEGWAEHSFNRKHLSLLGSKNFINWKGKCAYCSLILIGTRDTVKNYMIFHTQDHKKVLSYDEEIVDRKEVRSKFRSLFFSDKKNSRSNSVSTVGDEAINEEESDDEEDDDDDDNGNEEEETQLPTPAQERSNPKCISDESSWYASTKGEQQCFLVVQLINSKIEQKNKSGSTDFGAMCIPCEQTFETKFEWQQHLSSQDHCRNVSPCDKQAIIKDLNVILIGNGTVLEKCSSLIKDF